MTKQVNFLIVFNHYSSAIIKIMEWNLIIVQKIIEIIIWET